MPKKIEKVLSYSLCRVFVDQIHSWTALAFSTARKNSGYSSHQLLIVFLQVPMRTANSTSVGRSLATIFGPNIVETRTYGGLLRK